MQLFKKKMLLVIFCSILKSISNFEQFQKKDGSHSLCIFENTDWAVQG